VEGGVTPPGPAVPEPSAFAMFASGALMVAHAVRRKRGGHAPAAR
jgi:hypothetical protein